MEQFIFRHTNKDKWEVIKNNCEKSLADFLKSFPKDFIVKITKYSPTRSDRQLRSYWMLINSVRKYMQEQGNNFTQDEVSNYFKERAEHYNYVMGKPVPKSIDSKSGTTVDEMQNLINVILEFGQQFGIRDCYIEPSDLKELLTYYR